MPTPRQNADDACPGALRLHAAADGPLARVRLPGGVLTGAQLAVLASLAASSGDGALELTSRANIQLRGVQADPAELAERLAGAGLLPSLAHETVRNIAAPPLAGPATRSLVEALDQGLCADAGLAALPGRFLFAIGRTPLAADVAALPVTDDATPEPATALADSATTAKPTAATGLAHCAAPGEPRAEAANTAAESGRPRRQWAIVLGGVDVGVRVATEQVVGTMLAAAHGFLAERAGREPRPWRLREIPDGARLVAERLAGPRTDARLPDPASEDEPLVGVLGEGTAVGVLVPLRRLTGVHLKVLARAERLAVTPGGGVVVRDLAPGDAERWVRDLQAVDLVTERDSKWVGVTTCAGRPGCGKALADVRRDAEEAARFVDGWPVHWAGCARGCGSPAGRHVRVEATTGGYLVDGEPVAGDLGEVVAARRA